MTPLILIPSKSYLVTKMTSNAKTTFQMKFQMAALLLFICLLNHLRCKLVSNRLIYSVKINQLPQVVPSHNTPHVSVS